MKNSLKKLEKKYSSLIELCNCIQAYMVGWDGDSFPIRLKNTDEVICVVDLDLTNIAKTYTFQTKDGNELPLIYGEYLDFSDYDSLYEDFFGEDVDRFINLRTTLSLLNRFEDAHSLDITVGFNRLNEIQLIFDGIEILVDYHNIEIRPVNDDSEDVDLLARTQFLRADLEYARSVVESLEAELEELEDRQPFQLR